MSVEDERKLFVAGLAEGVTEDVLRQLFEADGGTVDEVSLPRDRATGRARGFGFVTMQTPEQAAAARQALDGTMQGGRQISVREFRGDRSGPAGRQPSAGRGPSGLRGGGGRSPGAAGAEDSTVYVGNLPYDASQADIESVFSEAGFEDVQRVHLPQDQDGRPRGFGFVTLKDAETAKRAVDEMVGAQMGGRSLSISQARARGTKQQRPPAGGPRPPRQHSSGGEDAPPPRESRSVPPDMLAFEPPPVNRGDDERRPRGGPPPNKKKKKSAKTRAWLKSGGPAGVGTRGSVRHGAATCSTIGTTTELDCSAGPDSSAVTLQRPV